MTSNSVAHKMEMYYLSYHNLFLRNTLRNFMYYRIFLPFSTAITKSPPAETPFMVDYLINSCGLSTEKAINASKALSHINSTDKPDSVLKFLKENGFHDTHIRNLISKRPKFLTANIDKTLRPKFTFFQELGLSGPAFADLVLKNPAILFRDIDNHLQPSIDLLRNFLCTEDNIIKVIKKSSWLLSFNLPKVMIPKVEILHRYGVSDRQISVLVLRHPQFVSRSPDWLEELISRMEKMGVKCKSGMLIYAIDAMSTMSNSTLEAKFKIFKGFGWTDEDILSAFQKAPNFLMFSESKVRDVMDFCLNELGYKPSEIALRPGLFMYSLKKRLVPRHEVWKVLKLRGLLRKDHNFCSFIDLSEERFLKDCVLRYIDKAPELQEVYRGSLR